MRPYVLAVLFLIALTSEASAQSAAEPQWTFGASVGRGRTWDDEGSIGAGWLVGGYADRRLTKHFDFEVAVDVLENKRSDRFVANGTTTYVSGVIIGRLGPRRANGFLMGGPVIAIFNGETGFSDESFRNERRSSNTGLTIAGGLSLRVANGVEIGPMVRAEAARLFW